MVPANHKLGYIFNALDFSNANISRNAARIENDIYKLNELGFDCFNLDLRNYFGKQNELNELVETLGAIWVSGGNTFILRQAMKLSGFDNILHNFNKKDDFLYGGYSAGICVLSPTLNGYQLVDDATDTPYDGIKEVLWDGLGIIDYTFVPHFESNHPESEDMNRVVEYCQRKGMPYKTLHDGEVIVIA